MVGWVKGNSENMFECSGMFVQNSANNKVFKYVQNRVMWSANLSSDISAELDCSYFE